MKNKWIKGFWRLAQPILHVRNKNIIRLPSLYWYFLKDWKQYRSLEGIANFADIHPCLFDKDAASQTGGGHYFYQDVWALRKLAALRPLEHHDIGSRFDGFVGQATTICKIICWDIRPPNFRLPDFEFRPGNILNLPIPDKSIQSLSCLHVAEHIGLGRYGDKLDPEGTKKALLELMRVLAPGGQLLFSMPVGKETVCFNGQRIWHPEKPLEIFQTLKLIEFKAVDDNGEFLDNVSPQDFVNANYSCGLYCFQRK